MGKPKIQKYKYIIIITLLIIILLKMTKAHIPSNLLTSLVMPRSIKPLQSVTIAIDPGHGGIDGGTKHGGILEKDINLAIGLKLRNLLKKKGANTIMTREIDVSLERFISEGSRHSRDLKARVKIIEESKADIFISIHVNHIKNPKPLGSIVFINPEVNHSEILGELIQEKLNNLSEYKNAGLEINRIPIFGDYYLLNNIKMPGVLIETGFISNELDRKLLLDENHQNEIVDLITDAILEYIKDTKYNKSFNIES